MYKHSDISCALALAGKEGGRVNEVRKELADFAEFMEVVLKDNDYKGGWQFMSMRDIIVRMYEELDEVRVTFNNVTTDTDLCKLKREAADVANFAMMLADLIDKQLRRS